MTYQEILPGERLKSYVKCYYMFESDSNVELDDMVFPGGHMEIIFNLGEGIWQSSVNEIYSTTPPVELWGKLTQPLAVKSVGKNKMLGIRFYAHSAAYFLNESIWEFNNQVADLRDLMGSPVKLLHAQLREVPELTKRIELIEHFLLRQLTSKHKKIDNIRMIGQIVREMQQQDDPENIDRIADRYHISARYLNKLFLEYTGVTPKLYSKIYRFKHSLELIAEKQCNLTSIAYECGYFDQSHFIRDFKSFAGVTPSAYSPDAYPVGQALTNN